MNDIEYRSVEICPGCGFAEAGPQECPKCGLVLAKFKHAEPRPVPEPPVATAAEKKTPGARFLMPLLLVLAVVVAADVAIERWDGGDVSPTEAAAEPFTSPARSAPSGMPSRVAQAPEPVVADPVVPDPVTPQPPSRAPAPDPPPELEPEPVEPPPPAPRPVVKTPEFRWRTGASAYISAIEGARRENKAVVVYFFTDWCGYCRTLERDVLPRPDVQQALRYVVKLRLNPEVGSGEQLLAARYGVRGFPSVYLHRNADARPMKIPSSLLLGSPAKFAATLREGLGS